MFLAVLSHPEAESRQRGGDRRYAERDAFEGGVAPRFVVGREYGDVHAAEQFVVVLVEDPVHAVEVRRDEHHLHRAGGIHQLRVFDLADDGIPLGGRQVVRDVAYHRRIHLRVRILEACLEVLARTDVAGRHGDVSQHRALERRGGAVGQLDQRIDEDVESLILEFVAAAGADDQRIGVVVDAEADFRHGDHLLAGGLAFLFQNVVGPDEVVFETVGRDQIDVFVEQVFAFARGQVAHRREAVVLFRRGLFERVFGHDAEFARQLVGIEFGQVAVQRHAVAGDRAAHHRRVRREDGGDVRVVLHQVEAAARGHPFVEVSCDLVGWRAEVLHVAFDHFRGREPEQYRLDVIPLAAERIHAVAFPQPFEHFVLV